MKDTLSPDIAFGIEIETPWAQMLARVDEEAAELLRAAGSYRNMDASTTARMQIGFDLLDETYGDLVGSVFGDDIKRGKDSFAEFALQPKRDTDKLLATVQHLYDIGILREGEAYPLQFTLGNVPAKVLTTYVLMATEICGGTTPSRIAEVNTWSMRGIGGLWKRRSAELQLGMKVGVELRSLELTGIAPLTQALKIAESGGRMVVESLAGDPKAIKRRNDLRVLLKNQAAKKGINAAVRWWNPQAVSSPWTEYASALQDVDWRANLQDGIQSILR